MVNKTKGHHKGKAKHNHHPGTIKIPYNRIGSKNISVSVAGEE